MARDFGDGKKEGVDFEMVPSRNTNTGEIIKDSKGNPVLTRRFFTRSEKAERAKPKAEPKPAPKPAPKPKPKAEPKPKPKPKPTMGGAKADERRAGSSPAAPPPTRPATFGKPAPDRSGGIGGTPARPPAAGGAKADERMTAKAPGKPKRVPGRALWLALTGGGNPKNYMDAAAAGYKRGGKLAKKPKGK